MYTLPILTQHKILVPINISRNLWENCSHYYELKALKVKTSKTIMVSPMLSLFVFLAYFGIIYYSSWQNKWKEDKKTW